MARGKLIFPADGLTSCVNGGRWENAEDVLPALRQFAMRSPIAELDLHADHAELTAAFLLGVWERRRLVRARVVETAKALSKSPAWELVLSASPLLLRVPQKESAEESPPSQVSSFPVEKTCEKLSSPTFSSPPVANLCEEQPPDSLSDYLPFQQCSQASGYEGIQAAHTQQSHPLHGCISGYVADLMDGPDKPLIENPFEDAAPPVVISELVALPNPYDDDYAVPMMPPQVDSMRTMSDMSAAAVEEIHPDAVPMLPLRVDSVRTMSDMSAPAIEEVHHDAVPMLPPRVDSMRTMSDMSAPATEEFHLAVQSVLAIDTLASFENQAMSAFAQLKKAVLHAAQLPKGGDEMFDALDAEAGSAEPVLTHLVDIVNASPIRKNQVCEVLGILLQCPSWANVASASHAIEELIAKSDTPPEVRAVFEESRKAVAKTGKPRVGFMKKLQSFFLGCGQKSGQGVSEPCMVSKERALSVSS